MVQGRVSYVSSTQNIFGVGGMIEMTVCEMRESVTTLAILLDNVPCRCPKALMCLCFQ